ncbi:MAG: succinate dehydrogenase, hydrophobic membrane anchor protein [Sulfuricella sp.]|nr:succinate dehydrogenase, hydrophobic membrane anchor protein [Sulfuricella sp.]
MVERVVTGAHYGLRDWLMQRVTAVAMALYAVFLTAFLLTHQPLQYADWSGLFHHPWMRLASLLFLLSLYLHAWVGVRDILMDYVHPVALRLAAEVLAILVLVAYAAWSVQILWGLQ